MIPFSNSFDNGFDWEENYWDLNILCEKQLIKHSRPFAGISKDYSGWYWYLWWWTEQFFEHLCYFYLQEINYQENKRMVSCVFSTVLKYPPLMAECCSHQLNVDWQLIHHSGDKKRS